MEQALAQHIAQQERVDEFTFCIVCGEKVYLDDRDTYETCQDGVICKGCGEVQHMSEWINDQVENGLDPIEEVEATFKGFTERAIERAAVTNGISREAVRLVLEL